MNLAAVKNIVTSKAARQVLLARKHSPVVLFGTGVVGVVATTVMASKATLKVGDILEESEEKSRLAEEVLASDNPKYDDSDYKRDLTIIKVQTAIKIAKLYAPAVGVGALSIAALTGSHVILSRRNAGLVAAYAALEKGFNEYRSRVVSEFGEDKDRELRYGYEKHEVVEETDKGHKVSEINRVKRGEPSIYAKFFDEYSQYWSKTPEYNKIFLKAQQNYANDMLRARGHVFLNEVYDMLGLERTKAGAVVGWVISKDQGDNFVDFGIFEGDSSRIRDFVNGHEASILLDFNVDGVIYDKI